MSAAHAIRRLLARAAWLVVLAVGWLIAAPPAVHAQDAPPDVAAHTEGLVIPPAPEGFESVQRGTVRWEFPERARGMVEPLFEVWDGALPRIERELGIEDDLPSIRVRVGVDPDQMRSLAPAEAPPPAYAVGVAYPGLSLILLTLTAPETWQRPELDDVLVHELSHIAFHHALGDGEAPLWLIEGVAIYQARERSIERVQTLWEAAFRGGIIDLDHLDRRFPSRPHSVSLAYAQSADFVAWLLRRSGPEKLGEMIGRMRRGQRFETAVSQTWSAGIGQLELDWRADLSNRFGALPMFATGSLGWGLVAVLIVLAWRRRKRRGAEIEERWAVEDARREQLALAYARHRARQLARERARALEAASALSRDAVSEAGNDRSDGAANEERDADGTWPLAEADAHRLRSGSMLTTAHAKPTTAFVVKPAQRAAEPGAAPVETFEADVDRADRPLH